MENLKKLSRAEMKSVLGGNEEPTCDDECSLEAGCTGGKDCEPLDCAWHGGTVIQGRCV